MNDQMERVVAALEGARRIGGGRTPEALSPGELMAVSEAVGRAKRLLDAAYLPIAAEINRQSRPELGKNSLANKQGYRNATALISATTGTSVGEAGRIMMVAGATAPRMTLTGEARPAKYPHVAEELVSGRIGMPASVAIITMLTRVAMRADPAASSTMEKTLVDAAPGLTLEQLQKLVQRAEAYLDPDGVEPREAQLYSDRVLAIREDRSGAILISGKFDPETGASIKTAVEGIVGGMLRRRRENASAPGGEVWEDTRSVRQMQADAFAALARHALGCEEIPTGVTTTIVLRMTLSDLQDGLGFGTIDGINQPVSAATVRRMAADAQVIPCVLGGESEILDWGRTRRLFTLPQKLAAGERDGGCSGCGLPPSMTEVHHLLWWARDHGLTDLVNALLLCTSCHHRVHDDGWEIRIEGIGVSAKVWFIPPAWVDSARIPRLGGRARFDLAA